MTPIGAPSKFEQVVAVWFVVKVAACCHLTMPAGARLLTDYKDKIVS